MTYQNNKYFTIWYGVYNRINRQLIYASAGHPPAILLSDRETTTQVKQLEISGIPIGMFPDAEYINHFCNIEQFNSLYIFSDGAYEIHLENGTIWDIEAFIELLKKYHNFQECNLDKILNYLVALNPKTSFDDDLSILQINFN